MATKIRLQRHGHKNYAFYPIVIADSRAPRDGRFIESILSNEGVLLMKHLQGGVKKGAFDEAEAQRRFDAWKQQRQANVDALKADMASKKEIALKARLEAEEAVNKSKAEAVAKKKAEIAAAEAAKAAEAAEAAAAEAAAAEAATEETPAEEAAAE